MAKPPDKKFQTSLAPGLQIAAWNQNEGNTSFKISKRYKNQAGEWQEAAGFFAGDIAAIAILAPQAIAYADQRKFEYFASKKPAQGGAQAAPAQQQRQQAAQQSLPPKQAASDVSFDDDDIPF